VGFLAHRTRAKRGGSFRASPSYVGGVLATAHNTEGHQPPANYHRQRSEDQRRREAAAFRSRGCGSRCSGRRGHRTLAGSVAVGLDQFDREGFPFLSPIPVSDNLTTPSTFRTDVLAVICPQMDVWHRSFLSLLACTLIASTYADDVIASTISLVISRIRCAFSASQPRLFLLLCPSLS
jgi:hypothetical protein